MTEAISASQSEPKVQKIKTPEPLASLLSGMGINVATFAHRPVFTVEEGRDIKAELPGGHTKNLFLKDKKGAMFLVTALDETMIDLKKLPVHVGAARFSFGSAERLQAALGVTPGSVTAFAMMNDHEKQVQPVLDKALFDHEIINCHPLINDKTTQVSPEDLVLFMKNLGFNPLVVDFSAI